MSVSSKQIGALAGAALSLCASSAFARDTIPTDAEYSLDGYSVTEFTSKTQPDTACAVAYYNGRFATDCFQKSKGAVNRQGRLLAAYNTSDGYEITDFIPATAPNVRCIIINYTDRSSMKCSPQP